MLRKTGASKSSAARTMATITSRRRAIFLRVAMPTPVLFQEKAVPEIQIVLPSEQKELVWSRGVARWVRCSLSVADPFVCRCLTSSTMLPFPHPAHRTGRADLPHPALGEDSCNRRGHYM